MILLSRYYREANIDQLVILKQHGENGMSRFYLPLGKKKCEAKSPPAKGYEVFLKIPPSRRTSVRRDGGMDVLKRLQGIRVVL